MPPRHAYWTILIEDQPTAFRAHDAEELLPTLNRLREKNASAVMKWFERGKLFDSRDQARDVGLGQGERRWEGPRPDRDQDGPRFRAGGREEGPTPRDKNWRPGGEHRDPRQKYKDAKKAKWNRFKDKIRERHEARGPRGPESFTPPHGDQLRPPAERRRDQQPREPWTPKPTAKPHGDKLSARPPRRDDDRDGRRWSDRPPRREDTRDQRTGSDRPPRRESDRNQRTWSDRPPRREHDRDTRPWSDRPPRRDETRGGGSSSRSREDSGGWRPKGPAAGRKPAGASDRRPWSGKPATGRKPWNAKPPGGAKRPWGAKPPKRRRDDE